MAEAADRLRRLRIAKGYETAADAARAFGWNEHTYKSHENGVRGIKLPAARKYAAAFGSSAAYILGVGNSSEPQLVNHVVNVPLLARVSASTFRYDDGIEEGAILVPAVPRKDIPASSQYSVIVDGPSVNKRIPDGAFAICAPYDRYPGGVRHGQLVHVVRERAGLREHTIKEVQFTKDGMILCPVSTDPKYQEVIAFNDTGEEDTEVRIQGVVIGSYQPF